MPYVYILECRDGSYYTGSTINLGKRIAQHQKGIGAKYTRSRLPVRLVYCEEYRRADDAFRREKHVQKWSHREKQALIAGNRGLLHKRAQCGNSSRCENTPAVKRRQFGHLGSAR
jgi:putative endonuclease